MSQRDELCTICGELWDSCSQVVWEASMWKPDRGGDKLGVTKDGCAVMQERWTRLYNEKVVWVDEPVFSDDLGEVFYS